MVAPTKKSPLSLLEMLKFFNNNTAMSKLAISSSSADNFSPWTSRLKTSWENITELDHQKSQEKVLQSCLLVYEVVAPNAKGDLFQAPSKSSARASEDDVSEDLSALMTAYRDAPCKRVKLQILSLYAYRFPTKRLMKYLESYEPLTRRQIKQARNMPKKKDLESHRKKLSNIEFAFQWQRSIISSILPIGLTSIKMWLVERNWPCLTSCAP